MANERPNAPHNLLVDRLNIQVSCPLRIKLLKNLSGHESEIVCLYEQSPTVDRLWAHRLKKERARHSHLSLVLLVRTLVREQRGQTERCKCIVGRNSEIDVS